MGIRQYTHEKSKWLPYASTLKYDHAAKLSAELYGTTACVPFPPQR